MNSSRFKDPTPFKTALCPGAEDQLHFMKKAIQYIRDLKILDGTKNTINAQFWWLDGMVMALCSTKSLMLYLCEQHGFDFLLTRCLKQDPLENYFSIIRQCNGFDTNPNCYGFSTAYKITMVNQVLVREKPKSMNCEKDDNDILIRFPTTKPAQESKILAQEEVYRVTSVNFTVQEQVTLEYLAGYFFGCLMKFHKLECPTCKAHKCKIDASKEHTKIETFPFLKRYCTEEASLFKASELFISHICLVQISECCFHNFMTN